MLTIPQKLLDAPFVQLYFHNSEMVLMKKDLAVSLQGRENYVGMHAFSFLISGSQHITTYEGESIRLKPGQLMCLKKGIYTIHDLISEKENFQSYLLFLSDQALNQLFQDLPGQSDSASNGQAVLIRKALPHLQLFWKSIEQFQELVQGDPTYWYQAKVRELFALFHIGQPDLLSEIRSFQSLQVRNLRQLMEANFDKGLSMKDYAYLSGRSESSFRREFKARFGTSPHKWLTQKRLEKAQHLLQQHTEVGAVAQEVGYESVSHFIAAFKKAYGYTPGQHPQRFNF